MQENRKQANAAEATRQSLIAELKWLESYLNIATMKFAAQSGIMDRGVKEYRWFLKHGMERNALEDLPAQFFKNRDTVLASSDEELATVLSLLPQQENRASEAPLTITNAVLSGAARYYRRLRELSEALGSVDPHAE